MLAGNVVSLLAPIVYVPVLSLIFRTPKYDWLSRKLIRKGDDSDLAAAAHMDFELVPVSPSSQIMKSAWSSISSKKQPRLLDR